MQRGGSDDEHGAGERRVKWGREGEREGGGVRRDPRGG